MRKRMGGPVPKDVELAKKQIAALKAVGRVLQKCQASLPLPAPEEIAHIRKARKTLTPETYRLGVYQRIMVAIENAGEDLHALHEHTLRERLQDLYLSHYEVIALEAAVEALGRDAASPSRAK